MPGPLLPALFACPTPAPVPTVSVEVVTTALVHADWKQVVDDGTAGAVDLPVQVGLIRHPDATIAVDAGLGLAARAGDYPGFPLSAIMAFTVPEGAALVEQLAAPPDLFLMTHLHYDHVGGLLDFPGATVWTTEDDWRAYGANARGGFPKALREGLDWRPQDLDAHGASMVLGRPALDVLGDGTVWYLSLTGHTPGAAAVLARAEDGPWLFVGDTAWVEAHLDGARRPPMVRAVIDSHPREVVQSVRWAQALKEQCPDLRVVVGHEPANAAGLSSAGSP